MTAEANISGKRLIGLLAIIFRILYFLLALGLIVWILYSLFVFVTDHPTFHMNFPVLFQLSGPGEWHHSDTITSSRLFVNNAMGLIAYRDIPKDFLAMYSILVLLVNLCALFCIDYVARILDSVKNGAFLIKENALRLRFIALLGILYFLIDKIALTLSAVYFSGKLELEGLMFSGFNLFTFVHMESLFQSLFLLVIAEAFRVGAQLKEESELTI